MKTRFIGFFDFIREQGIVGFAIGFILGGAVSNVTKSLVNDVVNPLIGLAFSGVRTLGQWQIGVVKIGSFLLTIIDFLVLAAVIYFVFKGLGLDRLDIKKQTP